MPEGFPMTIAPERREEFAPGLDKELLALIQATAEVEIAANGVGNQVSGGCDAPPASALSAPLAHPDRVNTMKRQVSAELDVDIHADTTLDFQIAVAPHPGAEVTETLSFVLNGKPIEALEITGLHGNRIHKFDAPVGHLEVRYDATIVGQTDPAPVSDYDLSMYLWPSRYAEADKFYGFAATEFGNYMPTRRRCWRRCRPGSAPDSTTCLARAIRSTARWTPCSPGNGVCRDYAHLVVALLRAVNVPARLVSVYAPGLSPMDFHAVAEAFVDGHWRVVDATCLAPRQTLGPHRHRT